VQLLQHFDLLNFIDRRIISAFSLVLRKIIWFWLRKVIKLRNSLELGKIPGTLRQKTECWIRSVFVGNFENM
jgi:hypothetical protein